MAYNNYLEERINKLLSEKGVPFETKKMMGGLCYMIDDKMCVGIVKEELMARVDPEIYAELLDRKGARPMDFTNRPMKGYVFVKPEGIDFEEDLEFWVEKCLEFNPKATSSKKKK
jgi:TfoX/Sxy family transcriptional regulator of competence genes